MINRSPELLHGFFTATVPFNTFTPSYTDEFGCFRLWMARTEEENSESWACFLRHN